MAATAMAEPKSKKKAEVSPEPVAPEASQFDLEAIHGAPAGLPLFLGIGLQRRLAVGAVGDPLEREADHVADKVMRSIDGRAGSGVPQFGTPASQSPSIRRKCACNGSSKKCEECQKREEELPGATVQGKARNDFLGNMAVQRKADGNVNGANSGNGKHGPAEASPIVHEALRSPGQPLDGQVRAQMESGFGRDFGDVRVHTDSVASKSAQAVNALAYTAGSDVVFASGQYSPASHQGMRLLAHELAHTVQQGQDTRDVLVRRQLDPSNPTAWDWYSAEQHRKDKGYLQTIAAAPGAAANLAKSLSDADAPRTDEEREARDEQIKTLTRVQGVAMVGAHRAELVSKKQFFADMASNPQGAAPASRPSADNKNPAAADTATAIRSAADSVTKLTAEKELLQGLSSDMEGAVRVNAGPDTIPDEYQTLWNDAQPDSAPIALQKLFETRNQLQGGGLSWGSKKFVLLTLRNDLMALRKKQFRGIDMSLLLLYNAFPFFADLPASYTKTGKKDEHSKSAAFGLGLASITIPALLPFAAYVAHDAFKADKPPDDETLLKEVQASFERLLEHTDEAIVKVGSGSIDPLDLPGAVAAAKSMLSPPLRPEIDRLQQEHEVAKFERDMILALGIAVLTGLTGGLAGVGLAAYAAGTSALAVGAGVAQLGIQLKEMMDRQTLGAASTDPQGRLIGVSAPATWEWAMFGVGAALTVADLAALAKEITAVKPHFIEEPHAPAAGAEEHPGVQKEEPVATKPSDAAAIPETPPVAGKLEPKNPGEARIIEAGKGDAVPSPEQIESEVTLVQQAEARPTPKGSEFVEEVELPNEHTWRQKANGSWCRFSDGRICVPGGKGKTAKELISSQQDVDKLIEPHRPDLAKPPESVKTPEDHEIWALYNDYFADRVDKIRTDIKSGNTVAHELPRTFESFKEIYSDPNLARMLSGRLKQSQLGSAIDKILTESKGVLSQDTAISRVPDPTREAGQIRRPDFMWPDQKGGFTAVSVKERAFTPTMAPEDVRRIVMEDIRAAVEDYWGVRYVRSKSHSLVGEPIRINEVVVNYVGVPESMRADMQAIGAAYSGVDVKIGFFEF